MNIEVNLHPNYRICSMSPVEIREELLTWNRDEMIAWLCWNNPEGIYMDRETIVAYGRVIRREAAMEFITYQIGIMGIE